MFTTNSTNFETFYLRINEVQNYFEVKYRLKL